MGALIQSSKISVVFSGKQCEGECSAPQMWRGCIGEVNKGETAQKSEADRESVRIEVMVAVDSIELWTVVTLDHSDQWQPEYWE